MCKFSRFYMKIGYFLTSIIQGIKAKRKNKGNNDFYDINNLEIKRVIREQNFCHVVQLSFVFKSSLHHSV